MESRVKSGSYVQHLETRVAELIEVLENNMNFNEYQIEAAATAVYQEKAYPVASLMIEAAELADIFVKPYLRGDATRPDRHKIISEAGDVLWNLAAILSDCNIKLDEVARYNISKLQDRASRGVLMGNGDER